STNDSATGGRLIVIAVDQPNLRLGAGAGISSAVNAFLNTLEPSDRVAAGAFGPGGPGTPVTADRERVERAVAPISGRDQRMTGLGGYSIAVSEAMEMARGQSFATETVIERECADQRGLEFNICREEVQNDAKMIAREAETDGDETVRSIRALLQGLR